MTKPRTNVVDTTVPVIKTPTEKLGKPTLTTGKKIPESPAYLGKFGQVAYKSLAQNLVDLGLADSADYRVLEAAAGAYDDYREARVVVDRDGQTYQTFTRDGELKVIKRPEMDIMADAWRRFASLLGQLCLTPASRSKGKTPSKPEEADPFAEFMTERKGSVN